MSPSISGVAVHLVNSAQGLSAAPGNVTQSFQKFHKLKLLFFFLMHQDGPRKTELQTAPHLSSL